MKKTLTIALTTFNRHKYLELSISSVLSQTFTDFDLVILDNGSDKRTKNVVDSFNDPRIQYIKNKKNDLEFVNNAFKLTDNEFLMIFHDDDIMEENMLDKLLSIIKNDSEINTISSKISLIDSNGEKLVKIRPRILRDKVWLKEQFIKEYFFRGDIIPCPATIFRSNIIKDNKLSYDWKVGPAVDLYLFFKLNLLPGKMVLFNEPLLNYRVHENQASETNRISLEFQVRPHIKKLLKDNGLDSLALKYTMASKAIILGLIINELIVGKIKINDFKNYYKKLKDDYGQLNFYSLYWFLFGTIRGIKNLIIK